MNDRRLTFGSRGEMRQLLRVGAVVTLAGFAALVLALLWP